jgi:Type II secretion system (T2SS), protein M subtype b
MIDSRYRLMPPAAAVLILLALIAAVSFGIMLPIAGSLQADDDLDRSLRLLAGYQHVAALRPALEQRLGARKQEEGALPGLWPGATAALAGVGLQGETRRLIDRAGGQIHAVQEVPAAEEGGFERIGFRFDLTLPMTSLPALLQAFDSHAPYIFLDKVDVHVPEGQVKAVPQLSIRWEVRGYRPGKPA